MIITALPNAGNGDARQLVQITNVTGGTFQLGFKGQLTTPIAWDAPGQGDCITIKSSPTPYC